MSNLGYSLMSARFVVDIAKAKAPKMNREELVKAIVDRNVQEIGQKHGSGWIRRDPDGFGDFWNCFTIFTQG